MKKLLLYLIVFAPLLGFGQALFYNYGSPVYAQKGSLIEVQGNFVNTISAHNNGTIKNDGIIEVSGNFENDSGAVFQVNTDSTSTDRAVKFIGNGTQQIIGSMNTAGSASFYNLVIDQVSPSDMVQMQASIAVQGSLVFGSSTITSTYNPTNFYNNNNQKGLLETYVDSAEFIVTVLDSNLDAIAGFPALVMNGAPGTGYILTSGIRGTANGGLARRISSATDYDFPLGTAAHGFNAVKLNFVSIPAGGGYVTGKFNDGSDNPSGAVGTLGIECVGCNENNPSPDNTGYNRFFTSNPCNDNSPQWLIFDNATITNHGYWSFESSANDASYVYSIETFANSYTEQGTVTDSWRTLKYGAGYGNNPSGASVNWTPYIDSVTNINDLISYTKNMGSSCYTGNGVPGGTYSGFGQFELGKSQSNDALPVTMLYLTATPVDDSIAVAWATAEEINNSGFEIDRSTDGINFDRIGWTPGHDNSTEQQNYTFIDNEVTANSVYYYRLRQIDNNGHSVLSTVVTAQVTGGITTSFTLSGLMPNPANSSTRFVADNMTANDINAKVYIYNMDGMVVYNQIYTLAQGQNNIVLNLATLASATYSVIIKAAGSSYNKMLEVNK